MRAKKELGLFVFPLDVTKERMMRKSYFLPQLVKSAPFEKHKKREAKTKQQPFRCITV